MIDDDFWSNRDFYNATDAAYLWRDMEPQEGEMPRRVDETYQDLIDGVRKEVITYDKELTHGQKISDKRSKIEPYWCYRREDLIVYAKKRGVKPLFLFPKIDNPQNDNGPKTAVLHENTSPKINKAKNVHTGREAIEKAYRLYFEKKGTKATWQALLEFMAENSIEENEITAKRNAGGDIMEIKIDGVTISREAFRARFKRAF